MIKSILTTVLLLICSSSFMTYAWYGHLDKMKGKFWLLAVLVSWGIAFFEYSLMIPATRIGTQQGGLSLPQMKILQETIALLVFIPINCFLFKGHFSWNYVGACICTLGAIWFIFR